MKNYFFHGTAEKFVPSIIKKGLIYSPKERAYKAGKYKSDVMRYMLKPTQKGVYLTPSCFQAIKYAKDTARTVGRWHRGALVVVLVDPKTTTATISPEHVALLIAKGIKAHKYATSSIHDCVINKDKIINKNSECYRLVRTGLKNVIQELLTWYYYPQDLAKVTKQLAKAYYPAAVAYIKYLAALDVQKNVMTKEDAVIRFGARLNPEKQYALFVKEAAKVAQVLMKLIRASLEQGLMEIIVPKVGFSGKVRIEAVVTFPVHKKKGVIKVEYAKSKAAVKAAVECIKTNVSPKMKLKT